MDKEIKTIHIGRQISRIRELRGMKQEALALALNVSQQRISNIENSRIIEDNKLEEIANALNVNKEVIKNFSDEVILNILNNESILNQTPNWNPSLMHVNFNALDKITELYERLVKAEKDLVQAERDKVIYLEKLLNKINKS